jgi:hypothetical protein
MSRYLVISVVSMANSKGRNDGILEEWNNEEGRME